MSQELISVLIGAGGSVIGSLFGFLAGLKLILYRLERLEKRVEAHNNIVERMYKIEGKVSENEHFIKDLKGRVFQ